MEARDLLIPLCVAIGGAALATPLVARTARALAIVDHPSERGVSARAGMPLAGGLAVAAGFAAGFAAALHAISEAVDPRQLDGLVMGATVMVVAGICDDRWGMNAWSKFLVQFFAAAIAIAHGFEIAHVTEPFTMKSIVLPEWLKWVVSALWIVGITNAINLVDGLDGLASGVGAIIGATLTVIASRPETSPANSSSSLATAAPTSLRIGPVRLTSTLSSSLVKSPTSSSGK